MTIFIVLLCVVVLGLTYLFFAPFYIEIDSSRDLYRIRFHRLIALELKPNEDWKLLLTVVGWQKDLDLENTFEPRKTVPPAPTQKKSKRKKAGFPFQKITALIRSFKVNKLYIRIDTGDMQLNGILYPVFAWLKWGRQHDVLINFTGENVVILEIKNNLARLSRAWFGSTK